MIASPLDYSAEGYLGGQIHSADTRSAPRTVQGELDAIIVGTGPGGLVTAAVLAEAGMSVAMLEAGRFWPRGSFERRQSRALEHLYQDRGARVTRGNTFIPLQSGRGVGGGTLVNSGICFRAPERVLDEWRAQWGIDLWEAREALFAEVERAIGVAPTRPEVAGGNTEVARRGFSRMPDVRHGYMPRNTPGCVGCGTCQTGCPSGGKASSDLNWLPRALRAGAVVYADSRAEEIVMEGGRAVGVRAVMRDPSDDRPLAEIDLRAERVILAAGTIHTPQLLQRHGLAGSSGELGRNLRMQPGCSVIAEMDEDVLVWRGATQGYFAYHPREPELLAETFSAPPEAFFTQAGRIGQGSAEFLRRLRKIAACATIIGDRSAGTVDGTGGGLPSLTYDVGRDDMRKLRLGLELIAEMFFEAGSRRVMPLVHGARRFTSFNEARQFIRGVDDPADLMLYASHPMGTCRMGADPATAVVRPDDGRLHDVEGLHVTDASLFPTALGVNPQVTIMAQSLGLARRMVGA